MVNLPAFDPRWKDACCRCEHVHTSPWNDEGKGRGLTWWCVHPRGLGARGHSYRQPCSLMRAPVSLCGPDAKLFAAAPDRALEIRRQEAEQWT